MRIRLGTRASQLAMVQARSVAAGLAGSGHRVEIVPISTVGDRVLDRDFSEIGSFGVFAREIEEALLAHTIDLAVHSYKDLPTRGPSGLAVVAVPERVDPSDVLVVRREALAEDGEIPLRPCSLVGTSSVRRRAFLEEMRPDLRFESLRGNVPTRVRRLAEGAYDAIVLAAAGLSRLLNDADGETPFTMPADVDVVRLDPRRFVPAPSQGAIAVQARADDIAIRVAARDVDVLRMHSGLRAERALLALSEAGCTFPLGAWCEADLGGSLVLHAAMQGGDGVVRRVVSCGEDPDRVAAVAWADLSGVRA